MCIADFLSWYLLKRYSLSLHKTKCIHIPIQMLTYIRVITSIILLCLSVTILCQIWEHWTLFSVEYLDYGLFVRIKKICSICKILLGVNNWVMFAFWNFQDKIVFYIFHSKLLKCCWKWRKWFQDWHRLSWFLSLLQLWVLTWEKKIFCEIVSYFYWVWKKMITQFTLNSWKHSKLIEMW